MGSRKTQNSLSKFGEWGSCERLEEEGGEREKSGEKYIAL